MIAQDRRANKPKYDFTNMIDGSLFGRGSAKASALLPRLEGRLVNAFGDFSR
jgi:hypothetical protein